MNTTKHFSVALIGVALLGACATQPKDEGRSGVDQLVTNRGYPVNANADVSQLIEQWVAEPLTVDTAVRIALLNNPDLRAEYTRLGIGAGELYQASRIRNPLLAASWLDLDPGSGTEFTWGLAASFTDIITLPARKRLAETGFAILQQEIGSEVVAVGAEAKHAFFEAVGAAQVATMRDQIAHGFSVANDLAQRFYDAGNINQYELSEHRIEASEAKISALSAQAEALAKRKHLAQILGLPVAGNWRTVSNLALPPAADESIDELMRQARQHRLDLSAAVKQTDLVADRRGVAGWARFLGDLDIGYERESEPEGDTLKGPTLEWDPPVFNQHLDEILQLDAELQQAVIAVAKLQLGIENDVYFQYQALQNIRAKLDEYQQRLIPAKSDTVARAQEQVNFMLIGVFELIAAKQHEYDAYEQYLDTVTAYWKARADLESAVGIALPGPRTGEGWTNAKLLIQHPKSQIGTYQHRVGDHQPVPSVKPASHHNHHGANQ